MSQKTAGGRRSVIHYLTCLLPALAVSPPTVASFTDLNGDYLTLETGPTIPLQVVSTSVNLPLPAGKELDGQNFSHGFVSFDMCSTGATVARMILPAGEEPDSYFMYGPTPDNPEPHYYEFLYDGETGAEIDGNVITLHFVDGRRGDADLEGNGVISDPGGPAFTAGIRSGGGGCSLAGTAGPLQAGA